MNGSAGYITVTTGLPDPAQLLLILIDIRFACAHTDAPRENFVFLKTILDQVQTLHVVAKGEYRATFGADEIVARDRQQALVLIPANGSFVDDLINVIVFLK
jgi:hypothetical protein